MLVNLHWVFVIDAYPLVIQLQVTVMLEVVRDGVRHIQHMRYFQVLQQGLILGVNVVTQV